MPSERLSTLFRAGQDGFVEVFGVEGMNGFGFMQGRSNNIVVNVIEACAWCAWPAPFDRPSLGISA